MNDPTCLSPLDPEGRLLMSHKPDVEELRAAAMGALGYLNGAARVGNQGAAVVGRRLAQALETDWEEGRLSDEGAEKIAVLLDEARGTPTPSKGGGR